MFKIFYSIIYLYTMVYASVTIAEILCGLELLSNSIKCH